MISDGILTNNFSFCFGFCKLSDNVLRLCVCLPLAQSFKFTTNVDGANSTKPLLCDVLSNDHIGVIARKIAREHAFENEFIYNSFVEAISKGMKIGRSVISKNIT